MAIAGPAVATSATGQQLAIGPPGPVGPPGKPGTPGAAGGLAGLTIDVNASGTGTVAATVVGIQNIPVSATSPTSGQSLVFSGSEYVPEDAAAGASQGTTALSNGLNSNLAVTSTTSIRLGSYTAAVELGGLKITPTPVAGAPFDVSFIEPGLQVTIKHLDPAATGSGTIKIYCPSLGNVILPIGQAPQIRLVLDATLGYYVLQTTGVHQPQTIDIRDWGAKIDSDGLGGGTDDSVVINNAIASLLGGSTNNNTGGWTVFMPAGNIRLSHPIHVPCCITLRGAAAGSPDSGTILVPDDKVQAVVVDFGDTYSTGLFADGSPLSVSTTVVAPSIGLSFPQSTIHVASTTGFPSSGEVMVQTAQGFQPVNYTGTTSNTFTGCDLGTTVAAGSDGFVLSQTPSSFQVAAVPAGWPATGITVDAFLQTSDGYQQQVQWTNYTTGGGVTTFSDFRSVRGGEGTAHTGYLLGLGPAYGTMTSTSAVLEGTPDADGSWCVLKDFGVNAASSTNYPQWAAGTAYSVGDVVVPLAPFDLNLVSYCGNGFRCVAVTSDAKTGSSEPPWVNIFGPTCGLQGLQIQDNHVTWQIFELAHGIRLYEISKLQNIYVQNMGGDGIRGWGDVGDVNIGSQSSISQIDYCRAQTCFGYALALGGADGSACMTIRMSGSSNRAGGIYDFSFLGNTYIGCHMEENGAYYGNYTYEYSSVDGNATSLFLGCYKEDGVFVLQSPAMAVNCPAFEFSTTTPFGISNGQYVGTGANSPILVTTTGTGNTNIQVGEFDTNTALLFRNNYEDTSFRLIWNDYGTTSTAWPEWYFDIFNIPAYCSAVFTGANHREGGNLLKSPRGIFVGPDLGDGGFDSGTKLTSGTAMPSGVNSDAAQRNQWRVGDEVINQNPASNGVEKWVCATRGGFTTTAWSAFGSFFGGDLVHPVTPNGFVYRAIGSGSSGSTEPSWSGSVGGVTTVDGVIYWENMGSSAPTFAPAMVNGGRIAHNMATDADYTLSATEDFAGIVEITDTGVVLTTARNIILPLWDGAQRVVNNKTLQSLIFKSSSGTGVTVVTTGVQHIYCDGTNWVG